MGKAAAPTAGLARSVEEGSRAISRISQRLVATGGRIYERLARVMPFLSCKAEEEEEEEV